MSMEYILINFLFKTLLATAREFLDWNICYWTMHFMEINSLVSYREYPKIQWILLLRMLPLYAIVWGFLFNSDLNWICVRVEINPDFVACHNILKSDSLMCFQDLENDSRSFDTFMTKFLRQHLGDLLEMPAFQLQRILQLILHHTFQDPQLVT
jgi:hypothetical protein